MIWCVLCWIFYGTFPFDLLGCGENSQPDVYVHVYVHAYVSMRMHVCICMCICVFVQYIPRNVRAVLLCQAVLCCGCALTDFPMSVGIVSLVLRQSNYCPSAGEATLMNMDKYFTWMNYERLHSRGRVEHDGAVCVFLGIYCMCIAGPLSGQLVAGGLPFNSHKRDICVFLVVSLNSLWPIDAFRD